MATINGTNNSDRLNGTPDDDVINGNGGNDTINAGDGDDTIEGGPGRDLVNAGNGNDVWLAGGTNSGSDTVRMEGGDDTAYLGFVTVGQAEIIDGGTGNDTIRMDDPVFQPVGGTIDLNDSGDATTAGFLGTIRNFENIIGNESNNTLGGNSEDNLLDGAGGNDTLFGEGGNDTLLGGAGNDSIRGGQGDDSIVAGDGFDNVNGDLGNDTIEGGGDNDNLSGGDDADTIIINTLGRSGVNNTTVNGGSGGNDDDTLDISALIAAGFEVTNFVQNPETNGNPGFNGQIQLFNAGTGQFANINFTDIENFVAVPICFTPGALIATPKGEVPVEELQPGDRVFTRDNGIQEICWVGQSDMSKVALAAQPRLRPILIRKGALGNGLPERDMWVSPNHRMLIRTDDSALLFDSHEVLVAAKHLLDQPGFAQVDVTAVSYLHVMCAHHEVILSNGAWTETFCPGDYSLAGLDHGQRTELFSLFPELQSKEGIAAFTPARRSLRRHEAQLLSL